MFRLAVLIPLALLLLVGASDAPSVFAGDSDSPWQCRISGAVTLSGTPTRATVVATRYAGVEAIEFWEARMPGFESPVVTEGDKTVEGVTAATGRYALEGLAPGCYTVLAKDEAGRTAHAIVACHQDGIRREVDLELVPGRSLEGRLTWANGEPIAGRLVLIGRQRAGRIHSGPYNPWWHAEDMLPDGPQRVTRLDGQGAFRFQGLPPDTNTIRVDTDKGYVLRGWELWKPTGEPIVWTVPQPSRLLKGRLVDAAERTPIAGASVSARCHLRSAPIVVTQATSGADGSFSIRVDESPVTLHVTAEGYHDLEPKVLTADAGDLAVKRLGRVSGRVVRADGSPAAGARVVVGSRTWVSRASPLRVGRSRADGRFEVAGVPLGERVVFVRGGGWVSPGLSDVSEQGRNPFLVAEAERTDLVLRVEPAPRLEGRVLDHVGAPVAGASVRALGVQRARGGKLFRAPAVHNACVGPAVIATDARGRFVFSDLVHGLLYEIRITAPGLPAVRVGPQPAQEQGASLDVRVPKPRWLDVIVREQATAEPVSGVSAVLYLDDGRPRWLPQPPSGKTDANGRLRFGPVGSGDLRVWLHHEDYVQSHNEFPVKRPVDGGPLVLNATLVKGLRIEGSVVDPDGTPVAHAYVRAKLADEERYVLGHAATDAQGAFVIKGLPPGPYKLGARATGSTDPELDHEAQAGAKDVVITLSAEDKAGPRTLTVRVTGPAGEAVAEADVSAECGTGSHGTSVRGGEARFEFDRLWIGNLPLFVVVSRPRDALGAPLPFGRTVVGPIKTEAGSVEVRLAAEAVIEGRVVEEDGTPVRGARVQARTPAATARKGRGARLANAGTSRTDAQGRFRLGQLGPGLHTLMVDVGGDFVRPVPLEVMAGAENVTLRVQRGVTARLVVLDHEGQRVVGARVRVDTTRSPRHAADGTSAADGSVILRGLPRDCTFRFEIVPPGSRQDLQEVRIREWKPTDGEMRLERGMVLAGEVHLASGELARRAEIRVRSEHMVGGLGVRYGKFHRGRLVPGKYTVTARAKGSKYDWDDDRLPSITVEGDKTDIVLTLPGE